MKKNINDRIVEEGIRLQNKYTEVFDRLHSNTNPAFQEPVSRSQQLREYMALTPQDIMGMVEKYGKESVNQFIYEHEQLKQDKRVGVNKDG